jgi:hypothetical protein
MKPPPKYIIISGDLRIATDGSWRYDPVSIPLPVAIAQAERWIDSRSSHEHLEVAETWLDAAEDERERRSVAAQKQKAKDAEILAYVRILKINPDDRRLPHDRLLSRATQTVALLDHGLGEIVQTDYEWQLFGTLLNKMSPEEALQTIAAAKQKPPPGDMIDP